MSAVDPTTFPPVEGPWRILASKYLIINHGVMPTEVGDLLYFGGMHYYNLTLGYKCSNPQSLFGYRLVTFIKVARCACAAPKRA